MVITCANQKGGVGKSRIACALSSMAAADGVEVVLLDADAQASSVNWGAIRKQSNIEPAIPVMASTAKPGREIARLSKSYDLVVVDIGAGSYKTMDECALLSDLVIVPCGTDQQEMESTVQVFDKLRTLDASHEFGRVPAFVVMTRVPSHPRSKETQGAREWFAAEGVPVFDAMLAQRSAWRNVGRTGRGPQELTGEDRDVKAAAEMRAVYDEIVARINGRENT